jgi:hypothetical protein
MPRKTSLDPAAPRRRRIADLGPDAKWRKARAAQDARQERLSARALREDRKAPPKDESHGT